MGTQLQEYLKKIQRKILRNYVFSGFRFIKGFTRNITKEKEFLEKLNLKGKTVYEVGCAAGIFTMFFARSVGPHGQVYAFEPVPLNHDIALKNFKDQHLSNITIFNIGLGSSQESKRIAIRASETATASMHADAFKVITSEEGSQTLIVDIDTFDHFIKTNNLPDPDFVKIDVEGMELDVLNGMQDTLKRIKPHLWIENHGEGDDKKLDLIKGITGFLLLRDYEIFHIESKTIINDKNYSVAKEGHIYCK